MSVVTVPTYAQSAKHDQELAFDIPAQSLESALAAFGTKSGFQVLYETALASGRRSHEVRGVYPPEAALRQLLLGTGLAFDYIEERAFTLMEAPHAAKRNVADFPDYLGLVQARLMAVLCQRAETQPGAYNVAMQFSIAQNGKIEDPHLLVSTGAENRDDMVMAALSHLTIERPPPLDMPQPVTMLLKSDGRGARECRNDRR